MGMCLMPNNPKVEPFSYNWAGWIRLFDHLKTWGVNVNEFDGLNNGELICEATCKKIADAIEKHLSELPKDEQFRLRPDIESWRNSNGVRQY